MNKFLALLVFCLVLAGPASAPGQDVGRIGLYVDDQHSANEAATPGTFSAYVFCLPSSDGMLCAEFGIDLPEGMTIFGVTENPAISVAIGTLTAGISACFVDCRTDWVWTHQFSVADIAGGPAEIAVVRHPAVGTRTFATCLPGYPLEEVFVSSKICLNQACPPDTDPPSPESMTTADGLTFMLTYDEEIYEPDAEFPSNYYVFRSDDPSDSIAVQYASAVGPDYRSITLRLERGVEENAMYRLRIRNVRDIAGNAVPEGTDISFIGVDEEPPDLLSAIAMSGVSVLVQYSEVVAEGSAEDVSNYTITPEEGVPDLTIGSVEQAPAGDAVFLTLLETLEQNRTYALVVSGITDMGGNLIDFAGPVYFTAIDSTPPQVSAVEAIDAQSVRVIFNEGVTPESAADIANYSIYRAESPDSVVSIGGIDIDSSIRVTLRLAGSLEIEAPYFISIAGVEDLNGLVMEPPGMTLPLVLEDLTRPTLASASAANDTTIELTFSEPMDTATTTAEAQYKVFRTGYIYDVIPVNLALPGGDGSAVTLLLGSPLLHGTYYTVEATNVMDAAGNTIRTPNTAQVLIPDTEAPIMVSLTLRSMARVEVFFSEPLAAAQATDQENYQIARDGDPSETITMTGAALSTDGTRVVLDFTPTLEDGGQYTLYAAGIIDLHGNVIMEGSSIGFAAEDIWPPTIVSSAVIDPGVVGLSFSEPLDESTAEDTGNYALYERGDPSAAIEIGAAYLEGSTVTLSLAADMADWTPYVLEVAGVTDLAGNSIAAGTKVQLVLSSDRPDALISLYLDLGRSGTSIKPGPYEMFDCYVWCLPSERGMMCVEYALEFMPTSDDFTCFAIEEIPNRDVVSVSFGNTRDGISECFSECRYDWTWVMKVTYMYVSGGGLIEVTNDPAVPSILAANCLAGYPTETARAGTPLQVNTYYIGTMLAGFDALFNGYAIEVSWSLDGNSEIPDFAVSRCEGAGGSFLEIPGASIVQDQMKFTFTDRDFGGGESYRYRVEYLDGTDRRFLFETEAVQTPLLPLSLAQNRPNPFNPSTTIIFYLPEPARAALEIFDVNGRCVRVLRDCAMQRGEHSVEWDGRDGRGNPLSSGVYFYKLTAGTEKISKKMVLLK